MPAWSRLKVADLRAALEQRGLSTEGTKPILIERLETAELKETVQKPKNVLVEEEEEVEEEDVRTKRKSMPSKKRTFAVVSATQKRRQNHQTVDDSGPQMIQKRKRSSLPKQQKVAVSRKSAKASTTADEMWIQILSFLPPESLAVADVVNKFLQTLARLDRVWQPYCSTGRLFYIAYQQRCFQCEEDRCTDGTSFPDNPRRFLQLGEEILVVCSNCSGYFQTFLARNVLPKFFPLSSQDITDLEGSTVVTIETALMRLKELYVRINSAFPKTAPLPRLVKELCSMGYLLEEAPLGLNNSKIYTRFDNFDEKYAAMVKGYPGNGVTWKKLVSTASKYITQQREYSLQQALGKKQHCFTSVLESAQAQSYIVRGLRGRSPIAPGPDQKSVFWDSIEDMIDEALSSIQLEEGSEQLLMKMKRAKFSVNIPGSSLLESEDLLPLLPVSSSLANSDAICALEVAKAEVGRLAQLLTAVHEQLQQLKQDDNETKEEMVPTCPNCSIKMMKRVGKLGRFYGCPSFPSCRQTFECLPPALTKVDYSDPRCLLEIAKVKLSQDFIEGANRFSVKLVSDIVSLYKKEKEKASLEAAHEAFAKKSEALLKAKRTKRRKKNDSHDGINRRAWRQEFFGH